MADLNKFEQMLEKLVNEDKAGAEELFHEIVVEKSRDIYEGLLEAELDDDEVDEATDEEVDESDDELDETDDEEVDESDDKELDEDFNLDEFEVEADPMDAMMGDMEVDGGDEAPAMDMDMGDEEGEGDVEDRVEDLEDALEELKAEFEAMMGDNDDGEADDDADDMDMNTDDEEEAEEEAMAFETADEEVEETADEEVEETQKSAGETMREYVEKVNATMGDNGANTKSATATPNHMGDGTAANLAQGADEKGGNADSAKDMSTGNINVPGGKAAKATKPNAKGHGAEKKGAGETADNKKSTIGK
tara:strand:- start:785 stop:1702 length:918 start_codon:yes stop_codon:yes gene_type:complete